MRIEEIGAGGDGVAIIDGARVFVPLTAPGDIAEIDIRGERGTLVALAGRSPYRAEPPCRHYGRCGGCSLQHVAHDFYHEWKRNRVVSALAREGFGGTQVKAMIQTPTASRRRAAFAVKKLQGRILLGFNARRSTDIVDIEDCLVLDPGLKVRLPALRALSSEIAAPSFDLSVTLCDNGLDIVVMGSAEAPRGAFLAGVINAAKAAGAARLSLNDEILALFAPPVVSFDGVCVIPPPGGFLQASREEEDTLIALVKEAAAGARKIADLFSGCGTFALPLAKTATVCAADADGASIDALVDAAANAQRAGIGINPVKAEKRDLFERPLTAKELKVFDAVVFDPPRAGAAAQAVEIAKSDVPLVIGVSCNPGTFARDAAILAQGGYTLSHVVPVDQFVYSPHVELVGVFNRM
ncbi:MAG: class I SAM-dependent RNA methyltransferase [Pseudomonadota bacterium]